MKLNVTDHVIHYGREQISVIQDGQPIPYEWTGPNEITVDDAFERAAVQITPHPRSADLRAPIEPGPKVSCAQFEGRPCHIIKDPSATIGIMDASGDYWIMQIGDDGQPTVQLVRRRDLISMEYGR